MHAFAACLQTGARFEAVALLAWKSETMAHGSESNEVMPWFGLPKIEHVGSGRPFAVQRHCWPLRHV